MPRRSGEVTEATLHIMMALATEPAHGYRIKQIVEDRTGRRVRLGSGTLYETIQRLEERAWIREVSLPRGEAGGRPGRRFYTLTAAGRRALLAELRKLADVVDFARREELLG